MRSSISDFTKMSKKMGLLNPVKRLKSGVAAVKGVNSGKLGSAAERYKRNKVK